MATIFANRRPIITSRMKRSVSVPLTTETPVPKTSGATTRSAPSTAKPRGGRAQAGKRRWRTATFIQRRALVNSAAARAQTRESPATAGAANHHDCFATKW